MKKGLVPLLLLALMAGLVGAQFYSGYSNFSPRRGLLDLFDPETVVYGLMFLIFFAISFYALGKFFKNPSGETNKGVAGTISFAISAIIVYGFYWSGFDVYGFLSGFSFFNNIAGYVIPLIVLVFVGFLIWKLGLASSFIITGLFLIAVSFTDLIYEKGIVLILGIALTIIGLWLKKKRTKTEDKTQPNSSETSEEENQREERSRQNNLQQQEATQRNRRSEQEKLALVRKIGVRNLKKQYKKSKEEYAQGLEKAKELHIKLTKAGGTKTKEGSKYYREWYRIYTRNLQLEKQIKEIEQRIKHLMR